MTIKTRPTVVIALRVLIVHFVSWLSFTVRRQQGKYTIFIDRVPKRVFVSLFRNLFIQIKYHLNLTLSFWCFLYIIMIFYWSIWIILQSFDVISPSGVSSVVCLPCLDCLFCVLIVVLGVIVAVPRYLDNHNTVMVRILNVLSSYFIYLRQQL